MTDMSWVSPVYNVVALTGAVLCVYVMQKTEHDRINAVDPMWLQWFRRLAFIASAMALCYSVLDDTWPRSLPVLLLITVGDINLAVNAVALYKRAPPSSGYRARNVSAKARSKFVP